MTNKIGQARDVLDAIGQRNEREGIHWTKYFMDQWDQRQWEENQIEKERLEQRRRFKESYFRLVEKMLKERVMGLDRPAPGYWAETGVTDRGVWAKLHDRWGRTFSRGIAVCGVPKYDHHAVLVLASEMEDKMWRLEEEKMTDSGIVLP